MAIRPVIDNTEDIENTEHHFHNTERWFGLRVPQTATLWGDTATLAPYQLTSGDNTWGAWVQILGSGDTPTIAGRTLFDPHRLKFVAVSQNTAYRVQFAWGTGSAADALAAGQVTESPPIVLDSVNPQTAVSGAEDVKFGQLAIGTKVWARCWNATNSATIDFFLGEHEYPV